jgi:hypothetical protein
MARVDRRFGIARQSPPLLTPSLLPSQVNTLTRTTSSRGCSHSSVSYADGININTVDNAEQHSARFRDKQLRKPRLQAGLHAAVSVAKACVRQNSTVNLFEHYFQGTESEITQEDRAIAMHSVARLVYVSLAISFAVNARHTPPPSVVHPDALPPFS